MLKEHRTRQIPGEPRRRWFFDDAMDLIVWTGEDDAILGFQLCYQLQGEEYAVTWKSDSGYSHSKVDTGEDSAVKNQTPILIRNDLFPKERLIEQFRENSTRIDEGIRALVLGKLRAYRPDEMDDS